MLHQCKQEVWNHKQLAKEKTKKLRGVFAFGVMEVEDEGE